MSPLAILGVPALRRALARAPGIQFWRVLGTGRGDAMTLGADLGRWMVVAVWRDEAALERFVHHPPHPWRRPMERWDAGLRLLTARGAWGGTTFSVAGPSDPPSGGVSTGPVVVLTRASIRPARLAAFYAAVPRADAAMRAASGRLASVGAGEWPIVRQATVSIWRSHADIDAFAFRARGHIAAIRRTREEDWYSEEMFCRFAVNWSAGRWGGRDPLAEHSEGAAAGAATN